MEPPPVAREEAKSRCEGAASTFGQRERVRSATLPEQGNFRERFLRTDAGTRLKLGPRSKMTSSHDELGDCISFISGCAIEAAEACRTPAITRGTSGAALAAVRKRRDAQNRRVHRDVRWQWLHEY